MTGLQQAARFGLQIKVDEVAGIQFGAGKVVDQAGELAGGGGREIRVACLSSTRLSSANAPPDVCRPPQGQGADGALGPVGQQLRQQGDEVAGVGVAARVGPVGLVDAVFHDGLVEVVRAGNR